ncbi:MAG: CoA transferase [Chloroflexi bacterium]|nr:CoA transferase [Chloroflexota bacterium]
MPGPLEGIRVIELSVIHVGPPIGYILGDLGAEVIKVERPDGGDPFRSMGGFWFEAINRNKKSIALDLKQEEGRQAFYRLVDKSDVFVSNYPEALLDRLGAGYDILGGRNPRLVYASVGSYGPQGPEKGRRAFEALIQARSGFTANISGGPTDAPMLLEGGLFDQTTATVMVYGLLAALVSRERTGKGQKVEGSLLGSAIHFQHGAVNYALWHEVFPDMSLPEGEGSPLAPRLDRAEASNALYNWYKCSDGRWIMFCEPDPDRWWGEFCRAIGAPDLTDDPRYADAGARSANRQELYAKLDEIFAQKTLASWLKALQEAELSMAYSPVNSPAELAQDPQATANRYITEIEHPKRGKMKVAGIPLRFSGTPTSTMSAAPELGEHTDEVLSQIGGLSSEEIARLRSQGVMG